MLTYDGLLKETWRKVIECEKLPKESHLALIEDAEELRNLWTQTQQWTLDSKTIRINYLNEIWLSEIPPPTGSHIDTSELVRYVISDDRDTFQERLREMAVGYDKEIGEVDWWSIMRNLWATVEWLFEEQRDFTVATVKAVHEKLTRDLLEPQLVGTFRHKSPDHIVSASRSSVIYCPPTKVEERVLVLMKFVEEESRSNEHQTSLLHAVYLGAFFFSEFLLIHPFLDANGRTARLLLSCLLHTRTVVPLSLYLQGDRTRTLYLKALEARSNGLKAPWSVVRYVLDCALAMARRSFHFSTF